MLEEDAVQRFIVILAVAAALVPRESTACGASQCGDLAYNLLGPQLFVPNIWNFGLDYGRFSREQATEHDPSVMEFDTEDKVTLSASRTVGSRLTLVGRLPFVNRSVTGGETGSLSGMSDPEIFAHFRASSGRGATWIGLTLGARLGWADNDRELHGERAEELLQPGAGSSAVEAGLAFSRLVGSGGSLFGSVAGRLNGRNEHGYHYGNLVLANTAYERELVSRINGVLELNFRYAAQDEFHPGDPNPNTGGTVVYASPRVLFKVNENLFFRIGVQVPLIEDLDGVQNENVNFLTGFTTRF